MKLRARYDLLALAAPFGIPLGIACNSGGGSGASDGKSAAAICEAYAMKQVECFPAYFTNHDQLATYCEAFIAADESEFGAECASAAKDYYECLSTIACSALDVDSCLAFDDARDAACGGGEDETTAHTGDDTSG